MITQIENFNYSYDDKSISNTFKLNVMLSFNLANILYSGRLTKARSKRVQFKKEPHRSLSGIVIENIFQNNFKNMIKKL